MKLNYLYVYQALVLLAVAAGVRGDWPDQDDDATTGPFHHGDTINLLHKSGNFFSVCAGCNDGGYSDLNPTAICKGTMTMWGDSPANNWNQYTVHVVNRKKQLIMLVSNWNQKLLGYTEQNGGSDDEPIYGIMFQKSPPDSDSHKPIKRHTWQWQKAPGNNIYLKAYVKGSSDDEPDLYISTCHKCRKLVNNAGRVPDVATIRPSRDPDDDDAESAYRKWKSDAALTVRVMRQG